MTTESVAASLPRWNLASIFPSVDSPELRAEIEALTQELTAQGRHFDLHGIDRRDDQPFSDVDVSTFESMIDRFGELQERLGTVSAYVNCSVHTDSYDSAAQHRRSAIQGLLVPATQLALRFTAWLGSLPAGLLMERSQAARDHAYMLGRARDSADHMMSPPQEALAAELETTSGTAWSRLQADIASQLTVDFDPGSGRTSMPVSALRNLAFHSERALRAQAHAAEMHAWSRVAVPMAAALNSVKGETLVLAANRKWDTPLEAALFSNGTDRATLDALLTAVRGSLPACRRYFKAKAAGLGLPALSWFDRFAPVGESARTWEFDEAREFILDQFGGYSADLQDLALHAFEQRWIDVGPRAGKIDGAYCVSILPGESRILANFAPSYRGMSTLAHELGHAYHNLKLALRTPFQRSTPMTLAETASIFCETIVREAALDQAPAEERLNILSASLQDTMHVVVDCVAQFDFEYSLFTARHNREQSVDELNALMSSAIQGAYGDGLDTEGIHHFRWALIPHYYRTGRPFYNFPYVFGLLFGLGLFARYRSDPTGFKAGYDDLLASTGLADAATLAERFGIDIRTPAFWSESLDIVQADIDRFVMLVAPGEAQP